MNTLTGREVQIFELVQGGKPYKNIASELDISIKTVEFHISNVYRKLNISNRFELERKKINYDMILKPYEQ